MVGAVTVVVLGRELVAQGAEVGFVVTVLGEEEVGAAGAGEEVADALVRAPGVDLPGAGAGPVSHEVVARVDGCPAGGRGEIGVVDGMQVCGAFGAFGVGLGVAVLLLRRRGLCGDCALGSQDDGLLLHGRRRRRERGSSFIDQELGPGNPVSDEAVHRRLLGRVLVGPDDPGRVDEVGVLDEGRKSELAVVRADDPVA